MSDRSITRVRHELRLRLLDVAEAERITPRLVRVTLSGDQLRGFTSLGFDDHVKVFIPPLGETFESLPEIGSGGPVFAAGTPKPEMRDYTPHHFDPDALTLQIDFALHDAGPATAWARRARKGDRVIVGGPRGSFVVGTGFESHLLIGDDTALPAIRRRVAELPEVSCVVVLAEVYGPEDEEPFEERPNLEVRWVHRVPHGTGRRSRLLDALSATGITLDTQYAWVACESSDAKSIRTALLDRGADPAALKASGYWRRGAAATHDMHG